MEKKETTFAEGFYFDRPREGAPDFVKGRLAITAGKAIAFINKHKNEKGYVNLDLLKSKDGTNLYFTLNDWKPENQDTNKPPFGEDEEQQEADNF